MGCFALTVPSPRRRCIALLLASLLVSPLPGLPGGGAAARAADQLELRLDGLTLPVDLPQLERWLDHPGTPSGDQATWLALLEPRTRNDLRKLLRAPVLRDRSLGRQLLDSWAGERLVERLGELVTSGDGRPLGPVLLSSLRQQLDRRGQLSTIEMLRAIPVPVVSVQLDGLVALAADWRRQLETQRRALQALRELALPERERFSPLDGLRPHAAAPPAKGPLALAVAHRPKPLDLQLWPARGKAQRTWVLLMPGLGGSAEQLAWLAEGLAERGWPVLVLSHPGSDEAAVRALVAGERPPPGAETLPDRLADVQEVLAAEQDGRLPSLGHGVVLMGHSLGGLTTLLAAGLRPDPGLERRCRTDLDGLPLANLSGLLQCQLPEVPLPRPLPLPQLRGVVVFNGFGSLLWGPRSLATLNLPVLMVGGSLDLVTPPLKEQLELFLPQRHRDSRLVLVEGGSHFSVVRVPQGQQALFQLGPEFVGIEPERVQAMLLALSRDFLQQLEHPGGLPAQRRRQGGVTAHVLDVEAAQRLRRGLRL